MCATFIGLPAELLDQIIECLSKEDVVHLWEAYQQSHRLNQFLFYPAPTLNHTMSVACKTGNSDLIRTAISWGADPSYISIEPGERSVKSIPKNTAEGSPESQRRASTLVMAGKRGHDEAVGVLLDLGASLKGATMNRLSKNIMEQHRWGMLRKLIDAGFGSYLVSHTSIDHSIIAFIKHETPVELLRTIIKGQDLDLVMRDGPRYAHCPLSMAIHKGSQSTVDLLIENGANIHGSVKFYSGQDISNPLRYVRFRHIPIIAAARRMAQTGSTDMMDLCLNHGADINQLTPAMYFYGHHWERSYCIYSPLMAYLEAIEAFPVTVKLDPTAGIGYFIRHGANIQPARSEWVREWDWLERETPALGKRDSLYEPLSAVEVLLGKWFLEKLHVPQFFQTIRHLIDQGSGVSRAEILIDTLCMDSKDTYSPLPQTHQDHPDNVPMWWDLVRLLWDKIDNTYDSPYAWIEHSLKPRYELRDLLDSGMSGQEFKDALLYTLVTRRDFFCSPWLYGTLDRLVIDRLQDLGANINAFAGYKGETLLYEVCRHVNVSYEKTENGPRISSASFSGTAEMYQVKFRELCLSLVGKGADPGLSVDGLTATDILLRGTEDDQRYNADFLVDLASQIGCKRMDFLDGVSTPSILDKRGDFLSLIVWGSYPSQYYSHGKRTTWVE